MPEVRLEFATLTRRLSVDARRSNLKRAISLLVVGILLLHVSAVLLCPYRTQSFINKLYPILNINVLYPLSFSQLILD